MTRMVHTSGPENYREAERLLARASISKSTTFEGHNPEADRDIAEAQVRATLALAAAVALTITTDTARRGDVEEWRAAVGGVR